MKQLFKLSNRNLMRILLCLTSTIICLSDPQVGVGISILGFAVVMIDYFRQAIFRKQECDFWMLGETLLEGRVSLADFVYGIGNAHGLLCMRKLDTNNCIFHGRIFILLLSDYLGFYT